MEVIVEMKQSKISRMTQTLGKTTDHENKSLPRKILILGDSVVKRIAGWRLRKRIKGTVAV